jgi:hypothetical protein
MLLIPVWKEVNGMEKSNPIVSSAILDFKIPREMVKSFEEDLRVVLKDSNPKGILLLSSRILASKEALNALEKNFDIVAIPRAK